MKTTNSFYIRFSNPEYLQSYNREVWKAKIKDLKTHIKPESSPGCPYALLGNTNELFFDRAGELFEDLVLDRIEARLLYSKSIKNLSRKQRIELNLLDPVRVFIKNEPHKIEKIREGRFRLIHSVSIVDKMIEMLLHSHLHKLEISNWRSIPSKPGIGFTESDNQLLFEQINSKHTAGDTQMSTDVSGWDWTVKKWMLDDLAQATIQLCDNPSPDWTTLVQLEPELESNSIYQFSDGILVAPVYSGIVNSGKYKTSRGNSWMRAYLGIIVGCKTIMTAGDDSVESFVEDAAAKYNSMGFKLKAYVPMNEGFDFCSRWYQDQQSWPLNANKMLMNLLHSDPKTDPEALSYLLQFTDNMSDHPEFEAYSKIIEQTYATDLFGFGGGSNN